jgi:hypothetical protein
VEWQEVSVPTNYRLDYGAPVIAAMSSRGKSIAVASSRGLCILECAPKSKKLEEKERTYLLPEYMPRTPKEKRAQFAPSRKTGAGYTLPPKWHLFGNEMEERSFRVLAMTWWEGNESKDAERHLCDDLLIAIIQLQNDDDSSGASYLACWSQRR